MVGTRAGALEAGVHEVLDLSPEPLQQERRALDEFSRQPGWLLDPNRFGLRSHTKKHSPIQSGVLLSFIYSMIGGADQ